MSSSPQIAITLNNLTLPKLFTGVAGFGRVVKVSLGTLAFRMEFLVSMDDSALANS